VIISFLCAEKARGSTEHEGLPSRVLIGGGLLIVAVTDVAATLGVAAKQIATNGTKAITIVRKFNNSNSLDQLLSKNTK